MHFLYILNRKKIRVTIIYLPVKCKLFNSYIELMLFCINMPRLTCLNDLWQLKEYQVVGRMMPRPRDRTPALYQMKIFAPDMCTAKSRFWYFVSQLKKMKKTQGEILQCKEVNQIFITSVMACLVWIYLMGTTFICTRMQ